MLSSYKVILFYFIFFVTFGVYKRRLRAKKKRERIDINKTKEILPSHFLESNKSWLRFEQALKL